MFKGLIKTEDEGLGLTMAGHVGNAYVLYNIICTSVLSVIICVYIK